MSKVMHKLLNEAELFQQLAAGDERAFERIYRHYHDRLAPFVDKMVRSSELSQEIIQDVFVQLWMNRALLAEVKHPTAYLFNMASNRTLDTLKKMANNAKLMDRIALRSTELSNETEESVLFKESAQLLDLAVSQLPAQRKLIYELSRNDGLTHEQIAQQLNISKNTVKNQLVHALKHIRECMESRASFFSYAVFFFLTRK